MDGSGAQKDVSNKGNIFITFYCLVLIEEPGILLSLYMNIQIHTPSLGVGEYVSHKIQIKISTFDRFDMTISIR